MSLTKNYKFIFPCLMIALSFLFSAQLVLAETGTSKALNGLDNTAKGGFGEDIVKTADLSETIGKIVGAFLAFLGVAFFILMIYGGYMWMFSLGNEQTTSKAKEIIIAAVIGLVIVLMAYAITSYIGGAVGKVR